METKICTKCGKELSIEEFNWRDKKRGTRRSECKYCHSKFMKEQYQKKKDALSKMKAEVGCAKCGDKREYVLDYHHINPDEKTSTIARLTSNKYKLETTLAETKKCVVLCSNCHREFHYFNKIKGIDIEDYLHNN